MKQALFAFAIIAAATNPTLAQIELTGSANFDVRDEPNVSRSVEQSASINDSSEQGDKGSRSSSMNRD